MHGLRSRHDIDIQCEFVYELVSPLGDLECCLESNWGRHESQVGFSPLGVAHFKAHLQVTGEPAAR